MDDRARPDAAEHSRHRAWRDRDASLRRQEAGASDVKEDRAAPSAPDRSTVPAEIQDHVVQSVVAPHRLVARPGRAADRPIVRGRSRIVAPAVTWSDSGQSDAGPGTRDAIGPEIGRDDAHPADRSAAVALPLASHRAGAAERAGKLDGSDAQPPPPLVARRGEDADNIDAATLHRTEGLQRDRGVKL